MLNLESFKGLVAWCHSLCLFWYYILHTFIPSHSYNTFIRRHSPRLLPISSSLVSSVGKTSLGCRAATPRPTELRRTLTELRRTLTDLRRTLLSYTVKKGSPFSRPQPGCHWLNSPWAGIFPPRESLVSDIPAGDGKIVKTFLQCMPHPTLESLIAEKIL